MPGPRFTIQESGRNGRENVDSYASLETHHPSANYKGITSNGIHSFESGRRTYARVGNEWEEVSHTRDGSTLVKKDFILGTSGHNGATTIPSPVAGYVHRLNNSVNTVEIYDKPFGTEDAKLLARSLHMQVGTVPAEGTKIAYGQPIGTMGGAGGYPTHGHVEAEAHLFNRYIADIHSGAITPTQWPSKDNNLSPENPARGNTPWTVEKWDQKAAITELQQTLRERGFRNNARQEIVADGIWGQNTKEALIAFQKANGLNGNGVVNEATLKALGLNQTQTQAQTGRPQTQTPSHAALATGAVPAAGTAATTQAGVATTRQAQSNPDAMANGVLQKGERGQAISELQKTLNQLGYRDAQGRALTTEGIFGQNTHDAVKAFQQANGLGQDGIAGPLTLKALEQARRQQQTQAQPQPPSKEPLLSDRSHPSHGLYQQAYDALQQIDPAKLGARNEQQLQNLAATAAFEARFSGLSRIDHMVINRDGSGLTAVQGSLSDPGNQRAYMDKEQAISQPVEQSTRLMAQETRQQDQQKEQAQQQTTTQSFKPHF
ncbi:MAG: peptidoglycan-binding protein [Xanthomonadaceae bacterium]|jgi:peptidoglycan hydrolase-like protein with peptidoglycan-binding domain|nr:peptidoglycan-binding protein [Xanthomonadaceae bacterium]